MILNRFDSTWLRPLNDEVAIDELIQRVNPVWALRKVRARVLEVRQETADTRTIVMSTNRNWSGYVPGQYIQMQVEIAGRRLTRCYSLTPTSKPNSIAVTVKAHDNGHVSRFINERVLEGDVFEISEAEGEFTLPASVPGKLLLISAGSGITPIFSQLSQLAAQGYQGDVVLRHVCRNEGDFIFKDQIAALSRKLPGLKLLPWYTGQHGRPSVQQLVEGVADYKDRHTMLCGPGAMIDAVKAHWEAAGLASKLQFERFGLAFAAPAEGDTATYEVHAIKSDLVIEARAGQPLLNEAEAAGLSPAYGCRMGVCHSCRCRKRSGVVQNVLTGQISSEPNELIQLCVSIPKSAVEIEL